MRLTKALRRCLFPEKDFRWYSRWAPDDLRARLQSVKPLPAAKPSFRRIGEGYDALYLWVEMEEVGFRMVARRLAPATSPELRIIGTVSAHGQGSVMAGTVRGGPTERITWSIVRLVVLLLAISRLLKNLSVQGGHHHLDAPTFIGWLVVVAAVAVAPFIQFSSLCGNLLPKVQRRFLVVAYPVKQ